MTKEEINQYMNEALMEGRKALPECLPNPPVGCVIVSNRQIVSRGHTNAPGEHHAEAMALARINTSEFQDLAMFVTLEPCSFQGRTPSCAKAIVKSGVKQVYVGMIDPHHRNQGKGIALLKEANIQVVLGVLKEKAEEALNDYLIRE